MQHASGLGPDDVERCTPAMVDAALAAGPDGAEQAVRLMRRGRRERTTGLTTVLLAHVDHPCRDVGLEVLRNLARAAPVAHPVAARTAERVIRSECVRIVPILEGLALGAGRVDPAGSLVRALSDERALAQERTLAALALVADEVTVARIAHWLASSDVRAHALAVQTAEVLVPRRIRRQATALLQWNVGPSAQSQEVARAMSRPAPRRGFDEVMAGLFEPDAMDATRRWTSVCILHAAIALHAPNRDALLQRARACTGDVRLTALLDWADVSTMAKKGSLTSAGSDFYARLPYP